MHLGHTEVQPPSAWSNYTHRNKLTNRWKAAQNATRLSTWIYENTSRLQLTEQDQALPVNINYIVNISSGGGAILIGKRTCIQRMYFNVRFRSVVNRMLMPGGNRV